RRRQLIAKTRERLYRNVQAVSFDQCAVIHDNDRLIPQGQAPTRGGKRKDRFVRRVHDDRDFFLRAATHSQEPPTSRVGHQDLVRTRGAPFFKKFQQLDAVAAWILV